MKAKFTIEIEATKDEINEFANNVNHFVHRKRNVVIDVKPVGGYVPRFYLPKRKRIFKGDKDKNERKIW